MTNLKSVMYAGLGLAKKTEDTVKESFDALVAKGKRVDADGNNLVKHYFNAMEDVVDSQKEKFNDRLNDQLDLVEDFISKVRMETKANAK